MRDKRLDIIKALAIVMMVAFHARAPEIFSSFGYLFHMGVFFVVTGWLFDFRHSESLSAIATYVKRKIVRLWFPVAFWTLLGVLFHNFLLDWNVISDCQMDVVIDADSVSERWSASYLIKQLTYVPFMVADGSQLCGAFWFLQSLFFVTTGYCIASRLLRLLGVNVLVSQTVLSLILLVVARYVNVPRISYIGGSHTLTAYALLHMGVLFRRFDMNVQSLRRRTVVVIGALCFLLLVLLRSQGRISLAANSYPSCLFLLVCTSCGFFLLDSVTALIPAKLGSVLAYVGRRTMPIVILHFLSFKLVSILIIYCKGYPLYRLAEFPVIIGETWLFVAYTIVGVGAPLFLRMVLEKVSKRMRNAVTQTS